MAGIARPLQADAQVFCVADLCRLCPVGAQVGAAGRRKVAQKGLRGQFRAILSFSVVRFPHLRGRQHEHETPATLALVPNR